MGIQLIEYARRCAVEKIVVIGTTCSYPKFTPVPFREEELWNGYPEETNAPYGIAKKALLVQCQAYREQYGTNAIYLMPVNLYGPRDNFDPRTSHVIPALIRKCLEARESGARRIVCWGDGSPTRSFLYAADAAEALVLAAERYDGAAPVNIGSDDEISIRDLVQNFATLCDYHGEIGGTSQAQRPAPPMPRYLARRADFGFRARTPATTASRPPLIGICNPGDCNPVWTVHRTGAASLPSDRSLASRIRHGFPRLLIPAADRAVGDVRCLTRRLSESLLYRNVMILAVFTRPIRIT